MSDETRQGKKWQTPPENYKLKSNVGALCDAAVARFEGKDFGQFYVTFCKDMSDRFKKYGDNTYVSPKQMAILAKLEVNNWPDGVKEEPRPTMGKVEKYENYSSDDVPF